MDVCEVGSGSVLQLIIGLGHTSRPGLSRLCITHKMVLNLSAYIQLYQINVCRV